MASGHPASGGVTLRGRDEERAVLDRLLDDARAGQSGVLVLRGDAGVGKTALLEHAIESASGFIVVRAVGVESEMELTYAALHQLCAPLLDRVDRIPAPATRGAGNDVWATRGFGSGSVRRWPGDVESVFRRQRRSDRC